MNGKTELVFTMANDWNETMVDQKVTYVLEVEGRVIIVENVPARVSLETGERHFAPETVERLQGMIWGAGEPARLVEIPVYQYAG
jgi:hypothetical protein